MFKDKSNCQIFSGSLFDDIKSYRLIEYGGNLNIEYTSNTELNTTDNSGGQKVNIGISTLQNIIGNVSEAWKPIFVDTNNSSVSNKVIENFNSLNKPRLGIENCISFTPEFKNFTVAPDPVMTVDWLLNTANQLFPGTACYGILCWARLSPETTGKLEKFPNGSRLRHVGGGHFIKVSDGSEDFLVDVSVDDSKLENNTGDFKFNYGSARKTLEQIGENKFTLVNRLTDNLLTNSSGRPIELWIPDGDFFTYKDYRHNEAGVRNYISPTLHSAYNRIYNLLTAGDQKPQLDEQLDLVKLRSIKRIAQALATSPLVLDMPENFLINEITDLLPTSTDYSVLKNDTTQAFGLLNNALVKIFKKINKLNPSRNLFNKTLNNNLITSKRDLFDKLVSKYQPYIKITKNTNVRYNRVLDNPNIFISQDISNECNKSKTGLIFNNQEIEFGKVAIKTKLSNQASFIELKHGEEIKTLPTADIMRSRPIPYEFSIGPDQKTKEDSIVIEGVIETAIDGIYPTFLWEVQEEPTDGCARFSDFGKSNAVGSQAKKFITSNETAPTVFMTKQGRYIVSCTVSTPFGTLYQEKKIYFTAGNTSTDTLAEARISKIVPDDLKASCPNLVSVGIGQVIGNNEEGKPTYGGLFWPISTDMQISVLKAGYDEDFDNLSGDEKYAFNYQADAVPNTNDNPLSIKYLPGETTIKLKSYTFAYGRTASSAYSNSSKCDNCQSFFERRTLSSTKIGDSAQSFLEARYAPDGGIALKRFGIDPILGILSEIDQETFDYPSVGNAYFPETPAYGGWNPSLISGRRLPQHSPLYGLSNSMSKNNPTASEGILTSAVANISGTWQSGNQASIKGYDFTANTYINKQKQLTNKNSDDDVPLVFYQKDYTGGHIFNCKKVCFEPDQGIIANPTGLYSPFLKFNPAGRTTRTFTGLGMVGLSTQYTQTQDGLKIKPKVFSSAIKLSVDIDIQKEPIETSDPAAAIRMRNAEEKKELPDHDDDYGYRHLSRGYATMGRFINGDEYGIEGSFEEQVNLGTMCQAPTINYVAAVRGVPKFPTVENNKLIIQQGGEIAKASVADLEVRLKFLNYVNPKDLIIWLDVNPSARDKQRINGADSFAGKKPPQCPIRGDRFHPDDACQSIPTGELSALKLEGAKDDIDLINHNVHDENRDNLRLYLTYKDTIEANTYNFSVVFSDDAPVKNRLHTVYNQKSTVAITGVEQDEEGNPVLDEDGNPVIETTISTTESKKINFSRNDADETINATPKFPAEYPIDAVQNNHKVRPTTSVPFKNDFHSQQHRTRLDLEGLQYTNASLSKFQGLQLFEPPVVEGGKDPLEASSSTTFTLNIAVADEPDNMRIYDTLKDNEITTGFLSSKVSAGSTDIYGSLCAWDLILHTQPQKTPEQGDALGMVDYTRPASFGGYTFKLDTPSKSLIPAVNVNAPYTYLDDLSRCIIPNSESIENPHMWPIRFPSEAIVYIVSASAAIAGFAFAGLGGLFAGMAVGQVMANIGYQALFNYFGQLRQVRQYEGIADFLYSSIYNNRVFGGPAKAIISFTTSALDPDDSYSNSPVSTFDKAIKNPKIWYKAEAGIFKYKNLPILRKKQHHFMRLSPKYTRAFSAFDYEVVDEPFTKITKNTIEHLKADTQTTNGVDGLKITEDGTIDRGNITSFPEIGSKEKHRILNENDGGSNQHILVRSRIPYDLFDQGDDICLFNDDTANEYKNNPDDNPLSETIILEKNLYNIDNTWYTLLTVPTGADIGSFDKMFMSDNSADKLYLLYDRQPTSGSIQKPISHWGLDLENGYIDASNPEVTFSTTAPGNYGSSSPLVKKRILSENYSTNQLQTIYDLFDNSKHSTPNNITASGQPITYDNDTSKYSVGSGIDGSLSVSKAFGYGFNESNKILYATSVADAIPTDADNLDLLEQKYDTYKFQTTPEFRNVTEYGSSFMYARGRDSFNNHDDCLGTFTINGVYEQVTPMYCSSDNKSLLQARLTALTGIKGNLMQDSFIGSTEKHDEVMDFGTIIDVTKHLNNLPDDPDSCLLLPGTKCYKKLTKQKLYELYRERNMILEVLDVPLNATQDSGYYELVLDQTDEGIIDNIDFKAINDNCYLVNIDPKQSCSQDIVNSTRVWVSTEYNVIDAYGGGGGDNFGMVNNFDVESTPEGMGKADVYYGRNGTIFTFRNPEITKTGSTGLTDQAKKALTDTSKWRERTFHKTFMMPDDGNKNLRYKRVDVKEKYYIAKPPQIKLRNDGIFGDQSALGDRVMNTIDLSDIDNINIKFLRIPRKLKHIDYYHDKYYPDENGVPRQQVGVVKDRMNIYYNEVYWLAVRGDNYTHTALPDFYRLMNEMTYRCFYSSIDGIEHKQSSLEAHEFWQWIPYEYEK